MPIPLVDTIHVLYDQAGHILWASNANPPYTPEGVVGQPVWNFVDAPFVVECQAAFFRALTEKTPQTITHPVPEIGTWRTTFHAARVRRCAPVAAFSHSRHVPEAVLLLSAAERTICKWLAMGLLSKEIAAKLRRSRSTIDNQRAAAANKIGIEPGELVAWCGRHVEWLA